MKRIIAIIAASQLVSGCAARVITSESMSPTLNDGDKVMESYFHLPYPARAAIGVASLPKGANVEMDAIMITS